MNTHPFVPLAIGVAVGLFVCLVLAKTSGPSKEKVAFDWSVQFCGGQDKDIQKFIYISTGAVVCKDGRSAMVPE